jgi:hypothetical protein
MHVHFFVEDQRRLTVTLINPRKGAPRYVGSLGALRLPLEAAERERWWSELAERFRLIDVKRPGLVSPDDKLEAIARIAERIPRRGETPPCALRPVPLSVKERMRSTVEEIHREVVAGLADGDEAAIDRAARRLRVLASYRRDPIAEAAGR